MFAFSFLVQVEILAFVIFERLLVLRHVLPAEIGKGGEDILSKDQSAEGLHK